MVSKFLPLCIYLSIYLIIRFSKFFMAVDVPLWLLVGMQPTHYFIRSDPCHLTLPLFVTLEEFFESVTIKWLVQTAFFIVFSHTLSYLLSELPNMSKIKKPCSYCFGTFLSSNLGNFSERIKTTGSMILLWGCWVILARLANFLSLIHEKAILYPYAFTLPRLSFIGRNQKQKEKREVNVSRTLLVLGTTAFP